MSLTTLLSVVIAGNSNRDKHELKEKLDACVIRRGNKSFHFQSHTINDAGRFDQQLNGVHFAIFTLQSHVCYPATSLKMGHTSNLLELQLPISRICAVGTRTEGMPPEYSRGDFNQRQHSTSSAYYHDIPYFSVNCASGDGIGELCEHIVDAITNVNRSRAKPLLNILMHKFDLFVNNTLDLAANVFALPVPGNVNQDTPDLEELDDEHVTKLAFSPAARLWDASLKERTNTHLSVDRIPTHRISPTLIVKANRPHERAAMDYVREHTRIPVPQARYRHLEDWLVQDLIEGEMLLECWEKQSMWMKFRIACTMRCYLAQLRQLKGDIPGRLDTHIVTGPLFDNYESGPFSSSRRFKAWCDMVAVTGWCSAMAYYKDAGHFHLMRPEPKPDEEAWDLVFAHGDLNPSNILLSKEGVLWIIDWAESGFYPPWYDGVVLAHYGEDCPRSWNILRPFMVGRKANFLHKYFWVFITQEAHRFCR